MSVDTLQPRYRARSASDRTDDWPLWYVADDRNGELNVTLKLIERVFGVHVVAMPFLAQEHAETLARRANGAAAG